ncbi:MAG TPA: amidohydrolase [Bryobacteraceae bacterium]|nr:amidohydrolase [Bryobacteraceae bacterium]
MRAIYHFLAISASVLLLQAADADLILHNGKIVTVDRNFSIRQAVAIKDGRIAAAGTSEAILKSERGTQTRVIDLKGRTVLPGLIDAHVHPLGAGLSEFRAPLPPLDSYAAVQSYIREQAKRTPKGQWIVVPRTFPTRLKEMRMPTREVLDVTKEHPVMFDASYVWVVNSKALEVSGIDRNTPNPPGGVIVKDEKGDPNGILKNAGALLKGLRRTETFSEEERLQALEAMLKRYAAAGLTTIGDRAVSVDSVALYEKLRARGPLPVRAVLTWRLGSAPPAEEVAAVIRKSNWTTNQGDGWLKFGTFKLTLDGGMTIGTAYQRYPYGVFGKQLYGQTDPDDRGQRFIAAEKLASVLDTARDKGWQLTAHSQGGGAVDALLDAFETLNRERPIAPTRSHVMHASFQSPEAIARMKRLGVLADVQAAWLYLDGPALTKVFGNDGMRYFFPLRSYVDAGIIVAGGSDHMIGFDKNSAVNPYNPFLGMWTAVTRKMKDGAVLHPEERISREEALKMYTIWAAYLQFDDEKKGAIEPGKLADLVVIDRDYMTCPEDEIKAVEPVATIIDGKIVWERK